MAQTVHVLRCYKCETFQSHIVKKSKKWDCKICGETQSIKRTFGSGTGKECRLHVQKLNTLRGAMIGDNSENQSTWTDAPATDHADRPTESHHLSTSVQCSKWNKYLEQPISDIRIDTISDNFSPSYTLNVDSEAKPQRKYCKRKYIVDAINKNDQSIREETKRMALSSVFNVSSICRDITDVNIKHNFDCNQISADSDGSMLWNNGNSHSLRMVNHDVTKPPQMVSKWSKYLDDDQHVSGNISDTVTKSAARIPLASKGNKFIFDTFMNCSNDLNNIDDILSL